MGRPINSREQYKVGEIRLAQHLTYPPTFYPARLVEKHWGPYGEKHYWYVEDLATGRRMGPVDLERISLRTLSEMEVAAWAAK